MRYLPLLLLLGCVDPVTREQPFECERAYEYTWNELDGGSCGPYDQLARDLTDCPISLPASCLGHTTVVCMDGSDWTWRYEADGGLVHMVSTVCESLYSLIPR